MNRRSVSGITAIAALAALTSSALSQQSFKEQVTGAWILVSNDNTAPDGKQRQLFGPDPQGILILDASGHYAQTQMRADRPKFAINNRLQGTAEENKAIVQGTVAFYGTWTFDEATKVLTMRLDASLFPNQVGEVSKRPITINGDEMRMNVPAPGAGGTTVSVYRRAK
jgi:hypothetical protein